MNTSEMRANEDALGEETATAAKNLKFWSNSNPNFNVNFFDDFYR